jgi:hypothetical protein
VLDCASECFGRQCQGYRNRLMRDFGRVKLTDDSNAGNGLQEHDLWTLIFTAS